jgi:competence protein ComEA
VQPTATPWRVFDAEPDASGVTASGAQKPAPGLTAPAPAPLLERPQVAIAGLIAALAIGAAAVVLAAGSIGGASLTGPGVETVGPGSSEASGTQLVAGGQLVVDVAGAVISPGVYRLPIGARVGDAIAAAGGFGPRVDADLVAQQLNLAAPLKDGDQVRVPARGDAAPASQGAPGSGGSGSEGAGKGALVNLNSATAAELDALPGIGPVTAAKIIDSRTGSPFKSVDELRSRGLVGQKVFDQIRAQLTVG